jgi:hypothetical protein
MLIPVVIRVDAERESRRPGEEVPGNGGGFFDPRKTKFF